MKKVVFLFAVCSIFPLQGMLDREFSKEEMTKFFFGDKKPGEKKSEKKKEEFSQEEMRKFFFNSLENEVAELEKRIEKLEEKAEEKDAFLKRIIRDLYYSFHAPKGLKELCFFCDTKELSWFFKKVEGKWPTIGSTTLFERET